MTPLTLTLPIRLQSCANLREHWVVRSKRTKGERSVVALAVAAQLKTCPTLPQNWAVKLTRIAPRGLDKDNLESAFKAIRDGVADGLGLSDDRHLDVECFQRKGKPKEYAVVIELGERTGRECPHCGGVLSD